MAASVKRRKTNHKQNERIAVIENDVRHLESGLGEVRTKQETLIEKINSLEKKIYAAMLVISTVAAILGPIVVRVVSNWLGV